MFSIGKFWSQLHGAMSPLVFALQSDVEVVTVIAAAEQALPSIAQAHATAVAAANRVFVSANEDVYLEMAAVAEQLYVGAQLIAGCLIGADTFDVDQYQEGVYVVLEVFEAMGQ